MSTPDKRFLRWFAGIGSGLMLAIIIWTYSILGSIDVMAEKIHQNETKSIELKDNHKSDIDIVRQDMWEMRADQKIMMSDIKEILKEMK